MTEKVCPVFSMNGLLGRLHFVRKIAIGGMGSIYLAQLPEGDSLFAVKVVPKKEMAADEISYFLRGECHLLPQLGNHKHLVHYRDHGKMNGNYCLVMDYIEGRSLVKILQDVRDGKIADLTRSQKIAIITQLLSALEHIHGLGIVHRDIKPANIHVSIKENDILHTSLLDFGIATYPGQNRTLAMPLSARRVAGSPMYMAPEQIHPQSLGPLDAVGPAADLYAVGILLYELFVHKPPFTGTLKDIFSAHLGRNPPLVHEKLPMDLRQVLLQALQKSPERRFANACSFRQCIEQLQSAKDPGSPWGKIFHVLAQWHSKMTGHSFNSSSATGHFPL